MGGRPNQLQGARAAFLPPTFPFFFTHPSFSSPQRSPGLSFLLLILLIQQLGRRRPGDPLDAENEKKQRERSPGKTEGKCRGRKEGRREKLDGRLDIQSSKYLLLIEGLLFRFSAYPMMLCLAGTESLSVEREDQDSPPPALSSLCVKYKNRSISSQALWPSGLPAPLMVVVGVYGFLASQSQSPRVDFEVLGFVAAEVSSRRPFLACSSGGGSSRIQPSRLLSSSLSPGGALPSQEDAY